MARHLLYQSDTDTSHSGVVRVRTLLVKLLFSLKKRSQEFNLLANIATTYPRVPVIYSSSFLKQLVAITRFEINRLNWMLLVPNSNLKAFSLSLFDSPQPGRWELNRYAPAFRNLTRVSLALAKAIVLVAYEPIEHLSRALTTGLK